MTTKQRIAALMPMRHSSERVPGKNYRPFGNGVPLFHHMVDALKASGRVDVIVIDTDSPTIREQCAQKYPDVVVLERPQHLLGGMTPMNDILLYDTTQVEADFFLQTHSTNPLLKPETIGKAIDTFFANYPIYDSLFSVTKVQTRFYDSLARAVNHNPNILIRTQDLPPLFEENSCLYLFHKDTLHRDHARIGKRPWLFEIDRYEAVDIDEEVDFRLAEELFKLLRV